jgi:hypothetical protein
MKLTKKRLQILIKEELSLLETNKGVGKSGRPWALDPMTGQKHFGKLPSDDDIPGNPTADVEKEEAEEANEAGDAYFVMVDDLVTSIGRQRATRVEGTEDEVYIRTGQAEGITVKVVRRGR